MFMVFMLFTGVLGNSNSLRHNGRQTAAGRGPTRKGLFTMTTKPSANATVCDLISSLTSHAKLTDAKLGSLRQTLRALTDSDQRAVAGEAGRALREYDRLVSEANAALRHLPSTLHGVLRATLPYPAATSA